MKLSDFSYHLPEELIAHYPLPERSASRLLCLRSGGAGIEHRVFNELPELLGADDLLVFNNTRVIPARLYGTKATGGQVEIMLERVLDNTTALAQIKASKAPKPGSVIHVADNDALRILDKEEGFYRLQVETPGKDLNETLVKHGHMPLPPYIRRADEESDQERYQTVYAENAGAVAAPTAGLHFDDALLLKLKEKGIESAFVTLHVGAGTFQPVRVEEIEDHQMHKEYLEVSQSVCDQVQETRARGGRVIAVGTTSVRCLETAASEQGELRPYYGDTDIFIYPGYRFRCVDVMITNFHLPESTLLMLVSAFAGIESIRKAYLEAVEHRYRFFSYGDAMFLESNPATNP